MAIYEEISPPPPLGGWRNTQQFDKEQALVVEGPDGCTRYPAHTPPPRDVLRGRNRRLYRVDLKPHEVRVDERLPSKRRARRFRADIRMVIGVDNAAKVVELRVEDPWTALEPIVMPRVRQLTRNHELDDLSRVELALERHLATEAREEAKALGLTVVRASVSLDIDEDELQRERDKLQDEHYQEMEELRTFHRARLEQVREQQQRLLNAAKAQHERELAALREQHRRELHEAWQKDYRGVAGDPLPELILAKLTTRPGGIDQKDLDDVIRLLAERRWEEYAMPLQLLSQHEGIIQDWQREKLIEAVLNGLAAQFPPAQPAVNEEPIEAEVDHQATEAVLIDPPPKLDPPEPDDRPG